MSPTIADARDSAHAAERAADREEHLAERAADAVGRAARRKTDHEDHLAERIADKLAEQTGKHAAGAPVTFPWLKAWVPAMVAVGMVIGSTAYQVATARADNVARDVKIEQATKAAETAAAQTKADAAEKIEQVRREQAEQKRRTEALENIAVEMRDQLAEMKGNIRLIVCKLAPQECTIRP